MVKKIFIICIVSLLIVSNVNAFDFSNFLKLGAPTNSSRIERTILPEADVRYELGTSTRQWLRVFTETLCLDNDCRSTWPTGGSGGGDFPFTVTGYGVSTSTTVGFLNGLLSTASSTFNSPLRLPTLSQGLSFIGTGGLIGSTATTSASCSGATSCTGFTVIGSSPITITSTDNTASTTLLANNNTFSGLNQFTNSGTTTFTGGLSLTRASTTATSTLAGLRILTGGLTISNINCSASNELLQTDASGNVICGTDDGAGGGSASTTLLADNNTWSGTNRFGALFVDGFTLDLTGNSSLTGTNTGDVTLAGENYLSLSGQQITANAINPDNLASADFGAFTCNGTNCSLDTAYLTSYDAWTHPSAGVSATTSSMIFTNASSTFTGNLNISGNSTTTNATTTNLAVSSLTSALVITNSAGSAQEYTGTSCTNQFVRSLSVLGAATCATVANTDLANSTISGIALGSNLANLTATDSTLTFSGTYNGGTARTIGLNLGNANSWTALQRFSNASSTLFSAGSAWFGGTATTTIDTAGNLVIPSGSNLTITGKSDGCATFSSGVLNSTGSACGGGSSASSTLLADNNTWTGSNNFGGSTVKMHTYPAFSYATSTSWTGTTTIPLGPAYTAESWSGVKCFTDTGTVNVSFYDGTNRMNMFNASTTVGTITLSTNNTFTASEKRYVDIGTPASSPTKISCSVDKIVNN